VLTAAVVVETLVLGLLAVIVVALLRSHAEILRRLPEADEDGAETRAGEETIVLSEAPGIPEHLPTPRRRPTKARDISGVTLDAGPVIVSMRSGTNTVLAFLSTGCLTCRTFWDGLRPELRQPLPGEARVVVVVKDPAFESPSKLRELAPSGVEVVHSSAAWEDFGVAMSPYFCFVDGSTGTVRSEGSAMSWEQVGSLLRDAILDEEVAAGR
jgi:hypothetical protein